MNEEEYPEIDALGAVKVPKGADSIKAPPGRCPQCRVKGSFREDDNITVDTMLDGERVVVSHLRGIRCAKCGEAALDPESARLVEEVLFRSNRPAIKFRRKVARIAKRPAIYLPKDMLVSMGLTNLKEVIIYPRNRRSVVIEFVSKGA